MTFRFHAEDHWRGVAGPERWASILHLLCITAVVLSLAWACFSQTNAVGVSSGGAATDAPGTNSWSYLKVPSEDNVITMPMRLASPLTSPQVASLENRLSKENFTNSANLKAALPKGAMLFPVAYLLRAERTTGVTRPYTEKISVCRLCENKDLVVIEDNRSGVDVIRKWLIRDVAHGKRSSQR
jgi:hypothetical protein